ncbi:MAG: ketol-acid reductoisomerase [Smithella sp. PtaU1.Bin162]|nr:MAG: ketol-acid reductoisomerase [Smithella sp. PtaU1.Bin162]
MKKDSYGFAIIGLGKVGTAIGYLLKKCGHRIIAVSDKSAAALKKALPYTGGRAFRDPKRAVQEADIILITTPDDIIAIVCKEIADPRLVCGKFIFHMSGAGGLDLLDSAKKAGAAVASVHPVQSFSSIDSAINNLPGSVFGITAENKAKKYAVKIVRNLGGTPIFISPDQKPLYHAAACFASNYLVSLLNVVELIYESVGINEENARKAYLPLVYGTLKNIESSGSISALTGPIARGDVSTIRKHITAIKKLHPQHSSLYSALGSVTTNIARKKGTLSLKQARIINDLLKGVTKYEQSK